jgi:hypothetical protein
MNAKTTAAVSAISTVLGLFAFWPSVQPFADWFIATSGNLLQRPVVHAVLTAVTLGVLVAGFVPHIPLKLIQNWPPTTTKAVTRSVGVLVAFLVAYRLQGPSTQKEIEAALIFSTLAATTTSAAWTTLSGLLYRVKAKPESLQ